VNMVYGADALYVVNTGDQHDLEDLQQQLSGGR